MHPTPSILTRPRTIGFSRLWSIEGCAEWKAVRDDDEVRSAVHEWLRTRPKEFFSRGIYALVKHWHKCIELAGDYVEQ